MNTDNHLRKRSTITLYILFTCLIAFTTISCKDDKPDKAPIKLAKSKQITSPKVNTGAITIVTETMDFQMPDTITSGWHTFKYLNKSSQTHFILVDKYPEGKSSKEAKELVAPVFDKAMQLIMDGKTQEGYAEFANLPDWFTEVEFLGGSGLISPQSVAQTTMHIAPGKYVIECYVKMANGIFHTSMGMVKDLVVTDVDSGNVPPKEDFSIAISSSQGIQFSNSVSAGTHQFKVMFKDQKPYEHFLGHDVHLVKINDTASISELERWMNWAEPDGLREPAPQGVKFLGGVNDMPSGSTAYFTATLQEGMYALIAEVPNATDKNMLKQFKVTK